MVFYLACLLTVVASAYSAAVDHGFPHHQIVILDGPETLDTALLFGFFVPCAEFFD